MKVRYIGAIDEVVTIIPGDDPTQIAAKRGDEVTVTKEQALILLLNDDNYEPADKAASALVAALAAEKE